MNGMPTIVATRESHELDAEQIRSQPFGTVFSPSMMLSYYAPDSGWSEPSIQPRGPLALDPATMALHYGQTAFEGVAAYRQSSGRLALFRPHDYMERLSRSCDRLAIASPPAAATVDAWSAFVAHEQRALPSADDLMLYVRPLIMGTDVVLGSRPSRTFLSVVLGVASSFAAADRLRFEVLVTERYVRAAPGGIGTAKTPGNYAASMLAHHAAKARGCDQVLWLDSGRHALIEELGSMNVCFVIDETVVTPALTDTILAGVTRDSVLVACRDLGIRTEERPVALAEILAARQWGGLREAFACSTGFGIVSIGALHHEEQRHELPAETPVTARIRHRLRQAQTGAQPLGTETGS